MSKFIIPERLQNLQKLQHEPVVSYLVKAEVSRYLKSEWQLTSEEIDELWEEFIKEMKTELIKVENFNVNLKELEQICSQVPLKEEGTIADLIHIQISKFFGLKFLTSEGRLKEKLENFYDNLMQINELY